MPLTLQSQRVTQVRFDYAVTLCTDSGFALRIETTFVIRDSMARVTTVEPAETGPGATQVLTLLHGAIASTDIDPSGLLTVSFGDGVELSVRPNEQFEAWTMNGPNGERAVCLPGGGISEWSGEQSSD